MSGKYCDLDSVDAVIPRISYGTGMLVDLGLLFSHHGKQIESLSFVAERNTSVFERCTSSKFNGLNVVQLLNGTFHFSVVSYLLKIL